MPTGLDVLCEREEGRDRVRSALRGYQSETLVPLALTRVVRLFDEGFDARLVFGRVVEEAASGVTISTCATGFWGKGVREEQKWEMEKADLGSSLRRT